MAAAANITVPSVLQKALVKNAGDLAAVQGAADNLVHLMSEIHGGFWRADIDHGAGAALVLIRRDNKETIRKPSSGAVV